MLRRETLPHHPWPQRTAILGGITLGGVAAIALLANGIARLDRLHERQRVVLPASILPLPCPGAAAPAATPPVPSPSPPPADEVTPAAAEPPAACPAPDPIRDSSAGKPLADFLPLDQYAADYDPAIGVTASPTRHGLLAAWSEQRIFVSRDDGRTFTRVLDGPGRVVAVAIDCRDRIVALRGEPSRDDPAAPGAARLGIHDGGGAEGWRELPDAFKLTIPDDPNAWQPSSPALAVSPQWIGVMTEVDVDNVFSRIGLSADDGATWKYRDLYSLADIDKRIQLTPDGTLRASVAWSDCSWEGAELYIGDADTTTLQHLELPAPRPGFQAAFGADGWIYDIQFGCSEDAPEANRGPLLCGLAPGAARWRKVMAVGDDYGPLHLADNGRVTLAAIGRELVRLHRGRSTATIARDLPAELDHLAVDSSGRALGLVRGHVVRHSPKRGWRILWGHALRD